MEPKEMHEQLVREIAAERQLEFSQASLQRQLIQERGQKREQELREALGKMGLDFGQLDRLEQGAEVESEARRQSLRAQLELGPQGLTARGGLDLGRGLTPRGTQVLVPSWSETFAEQGPQSETAALDAQAVIPGGGYKKYFNWAKGGGSGLFGTGVGVNQSWVEFGGWFRADANRFYSFVPHFQLRGFYIVQADDGFFTSKEARVVVSCWTNVYQYNWKGWSHVDVLNVGGDNIDVNQRFDADRYPYSSYLLGADWAFVRCTIGLYTYARGGGSYALNDFNAGSANYLGVPEIYIS